MGEKFIDPFGAPEFFCSGLAYHQMAAPGIVRFVFYTEEGDPLEQVIRVKLLVPAAIIPGNQIRTKSFLAKHTMGIGGLAITFA